MAVGASDVAGVTLMLKVASEPTLGSEGVQTAEGALIKAIWYSQARATSVEGNGWMIGPYATVRLSNNLYFQTRAAWGAGQSAT